MDKNEFLTRLFHRFPPAKNANSEFHYYTEVLKTKDEEKYDYDKLWIVVGREYKYQTTPSTAWLYEKRQECLKERAPKRRTAGPDEGKLLFITFENGNTLSLTITGFGEQIEPAKKKMEALYGKIKSIEKYPAGTVIIGDNVYLPSGTVYNRNLKQIA